MKQYLTSLALVIAALVAFPTSQANAQSQAEMNRKAAKDFEKFDTELNKTYQALLAKLPDAASKQKLKEKQRAWISSRDAEAARAADEARGGSMAPMLRYEAMAELTQQRIKQLKTSLTDGAAPNEKEANPPTPRPTATSSASTQGPDEKPAAAAPKPTSVSPDKQWEYKCEECSAALPRPQIVKAGTSQRVVDLNEEVPDGVNGIDTEVVWAPDSKRFAFNYGTQLTHHSYRNIAFYQLRGDKWEALVSLVDGLADQVYPRQCDPYQGEWQLRNWTDPNTAILYAACPGKRESAFLLTLKFDDAGNWKLTKSHRMSDKEVEKREKGQ